MGGLMLPQDDQLATRRVWRAALAFCVVVWVGVVLFAAWGLGLL